MHTHQLELDVLTVPIKLYTITPPAATTYSRTGSSLTLLALFRTSAKSFFERLANQISFRKLRSAPNLGFFVRNAGRRRRRHVAVAKSSYGS